MEDTQQQQEQATATTEPTTTTATLPAPKKRQPNAWIQHVSAYRKANAEKIKCERLSCGQISKLARATYKTRAKCTQCGK